MIWIPTLGGDGVHIAQARGALGREPPAQARAIHTGPPRDLADREIPLLHLAKNGYGDGVHSPEYRGQRTVLCPRCCAVAQSSAREPVCCACVGVGGWMPRSSMDA